MFSGEMFDIASLKVIDGMLTGHNIKICMSASMSPGVLGSFSCIL